MLLKLNQKCLMKHRKLFLLNKLIFISFFSLPIANEIKEIENGIYPKDDNPLVNAPHTAKSLISGEWNHAYSREKAAYPNQFGVLNKYWVPVSRIDDAYGDRNLVCSCPPLEEYA